MLSNCYLCCRPNSITLRNETDVPCHVKTGVIITPIQITLLVCAILALAQAGAFQDMSLNWRLTLVIPGLLITASDIFFLLYTRSSMKQEEKKISLESLARRGIKLKVNDKEGYILDLGINRSLLDGYFVKLNDPNQREYPVHPPQKNNPDLLGIDEYLFYTENPNDGDLNDVRALCKLKDNDTQEVTIHRFTLTQFLELTQSKIRHANLAPKVSE